MIRSVFKIKPGTHGDLLPQCVNGFAALIAVTLLILSFLKPWFAIPVAVEAVDADFGTEDSVITLFFKVLIFTLGIFLFIAATGRWHRLKRNFIYFSVVGFLLMLAFPGWLTMRDSKIMGDAAWLQQQHDNMTWLGGDVYRAHSERSLNLGAGIQAQDPPSRLAIYKPPVTSISLTRLDDWISWLGYGPAFTQFVGKGWFYGMIGFFLSLICIIGHHWRRDLAEARLLLRKLSSRIGLGLILIFSLNALIIASTHHFLARSKAALTEGSYRQAEEDLDRAIALMPTLFCDSGILRQKGYLQLKNGVPESSYTSLYTIQYLEEQGYYAQARTLLDQERHRLHELPHAAAREILRHEVRVAVNEMNSGKHHQAGERLDRILLEVPHAPQARFHRQLIALHTGELETNRAMMESLAEIYRLFKSKNKRGVLSAGWLMLAQGELNAGNVKAAGEARQKSKGL